MTDPSLRRLDALERQAAGMLKQRQLDRDRILVLEKRCDKAEAAAISLMYELNNARLAMVALSQSGVTVRQ